MSTASLCFSSSAASAQRARAALQQQWELAGLPARALSQLRLTGRARGFVSSFAVVDAVQASVAAAALAATQVEQLRQPRRPVQMVTVDAQHAAFESSGYFTLDGRRPDPWAPVSGLYACGQAVGEPGWVRIHANFDHHRDGALALLGLPEGAATPREAVAQALAHWRAQDVETQAAVRGLPVAASRSHAQWQSLGQEERVAGTALVQIERVGDAPALPWPGLQNGQRPLAGLRVLDLTRILAGPVAGRTLAAYGADVMLVNSPHLPNIDAIADTSRGKRSTHADMNEAAGHDALSMLVRGAHVFMQAYRPGALQAKGFGTEQLLQMRPGLVVAELCAYGWEGPWAGRRGFDSLVQTASGINEDEAAAHGSAQPRALPMQALDYGAGFWLAFGVEAALLRQAQQGGSWRVRVTLAGVAHWLRGLGRVQVAGHAWTEARPDIAPYLQTLDSGFGKLQAVRHSARFSHTPVAWDHASMPPGSSQPRW